MVELLRRVGIAVGSFVAAWLAVSVVGVLVIGPVAQGSLLTWLFTIALGGLIYADIVRRDRGRPRAMHGQDDRAVSMAGSPPSTREWLTALLVVGIVAAVVVALLVLFTALVAQPSVG